MKWRPQVFAFAAAIFLGWATYRNYYHHDPHSDHATNFILCAIFVVGVPLWFLFEYSFFAPPNPDSPDAKRFKQLQDLAAKVWAAGILILTAAATDVVPK